MQARRDGNVEIELFYLGEAGGDFFRMPGC